MSRKILTIYPRSIDIIRVIIALVACSVSVIAQGDVAKDEDTTPDNDPGHNTGEIITHTLESEFQPYGSELRVLLPEPLEPGHRYKVLYVLPVEPTQSYKHGDGLLEVKKLNLHNKYGIICVSPGFSKFPWYADNPTDINDRQESHLIKAVIPFVERNYSVVTEPQGRLLVGFSKSGWGAYTLLLRHPDIFGRAASWDAPLTMKRRPEVWAKHRQGECWPTQEDFEPYDVMKLLARRAPLLREQPVRLIVLGHGAFLEDDVKLHEYMKELGIPHYWDHGDRIVHSWSSGWLEPAVSLLVGND